MSTKKPSGPDARPGVQSAPESLGEATESLPEAQAAEEIIIGPEMTERELREALVAVMGRPVWVSFRGPIPTAVPEPVAAGEPVAPRRVNTSTGTIWCGACDNSQPERYPACLKCGTLVLR